MQSSNFTDVKIQMKVEFKDGRGLSYGGKADKVFGPFKKDIPIIFPRAKGDDFYFLFIQST